MRALSLTLLALVSCAAQGGNRPRPTRVPEAAIASEEGIDPGEPQASPPEPTTPPASVPVSTVDPVPSPAVARVAGQVIGVDELLLAWTHRESQVVRRYLDELVLDRIVVAEALRLGLVLSPGEEQAALEGVRNRIAAEIQRAGGMDPKAFLEQELGLDPERYYAAAERSAVVERLAERCVRAFTLSQPRRDVAIILCESQESADLVQSGLALGTPFEDLARQHSVDGSREAGGRIPPVLRSDSALSRLAFHTGLGEVGGPLRQGGRWLFVQVVGEPLPQEGPWERLGPLVLESLGDQAITDPEYWQWKEAMLQRYEVDTTPFLELIGEPPIEGPGEDA